MDKNDKKNDQSVKLLGLELFSKDREQLLKILQSALTGSKHPFLVATPNPEQIVQARQDQEFLAHLREMDLLLPDGIGLVVASRLFVLAGRSKTQLTTRLAGVDIVADLLGLSASQGLKVLLIGGRDYQTSAGFRVGESDWQIIDLAESSDEAKTASSSSDSHPLYWTSGFSNYAGADRVTREAEQARLADQLKSLRPDLVLVALGAPHQERWLIENKELLAAAGTRLGMVVGGSFDFLLGKVERAPRAVREIGLEWAYRLLKEPWRARRQLRLVEFLGLLVRILLWIEAEQPEN